MLNRASEGAEGPSRGQAAEQAEWDGEGDVAEAAVG